MKNLIIVVAQQGGKDVIMKYDLKLRPIHYASVSGGKDSLYMLKVILENPDKYPLDLVVHFELEIDYPWVKNVINYMEHELEKINVKLIRIKPLVSYEELYTKYMFPNRMFRWCNSLYKLSCKEQLEKWILEQNCRPVAYIGFCADETKRFKYTIGENLEIQDSIYPLAEEGYIESSILDWAKKQDIFEDYYIINKRQGCMFCPMSDYTQLAYLYIKYPAYFEQLFTMCIETENKKGSSIFQSNPKYNSEYVRNRVIEKYVPKVLEIISNNCQ